MRFHAAHSILFFSWWAVIWSVLQLFEWLSDWLLASVFDDLQLGFNIGGLLIWAALMHSAYQGRRLVFLQPLHMLAARLASRGYRRTGTDAPARYSVWHSARATIHAMRFRT